MATVISFINLKGGVGKTTCCVNIAGEFASSHKKVLVIDLDAQANTSILLMNQERYCEKVLLQNQKPEASEEDIISQTVYQIFLDEINRTNRFSFDDAIIRSVVNNKGKQPLPSLDLLPASFHLQKLERDIVNYDRTKYIILNKVLEEVKGGYDLIFLDCPPNLYTATNNALYASDYYIIPSLPEKLSLFGVKLLIEQLNRVAEIAQEESSKSVKLAGILLNLVAERTNAHKEGIEEIKKKLASFKEDGLIDKNAKVFDIMIKQKTALREASASFLPICVYDPRNEVTADFKRICAEILEQIK